MFMKECCAFQPLLRGTNVKVLDRKTFDSIPSFGRTYICIPWGQFLGLTPHVQKRHFFTRRVHRVQLQTSTSLIKYKRLDVVDNRQNSTNPADVKLKPKVKKSSGPITVEHLDKVRQENKQIMTRLLGVDSECFKRVPYTLIDETRAKRTIEKLQNFGFSTGAVHLFPELLHMDAGPVENYIRIMKEAGFTQIREQFIVKFRGVINRPIPILQREVGMPELSTVVKRFCEELQVDQEFCNRFIEKVPSNLGRVTLYDLRRQIIASYYIKLSLGPSDDIYARLFEKTPRLNYRCLNWIRRAYEFAKDLEFSHEKILKHPYLLHIDPDNARRIMSISSLAGMPIRSLIQARPRLLISQYDALLDKEKAFVEHKIPFESIQKHPEVFTLSSVTIRKRLEEMDETPEFRPLKIHPRISRILYYYTKAKERLVDFRGMQVMAPSIHLLSQDKKKYEKIISVGDIRFRGVDIILCVSKLLDVDRSLVRQSLMRHPHWIHVPILNVKECLTYIQSLYNFTTPQLVDAIPLMLYPKEKVEKGVDDVLSSGEAKLSDPYFLKMVLYFVERDTHFTGDGIWPDKMKHYEAEEAHDDHEDEEEAEGDKI